MNESGMINSIKGSREIEQAKTGNLLVGDKIREMINGETTQWFLRNGALYKWTG